MIMPRAQFQLCHNCLVISRPYRGRGGGDIRKGHRIISTFGSLRSVYGSRFFFFVDVMSLMVL